MLLTTAAVIFFWKMIELNKVGFPYDNASGKYPLIPVPEISRFYSGIRQGHGPGSVSLVLRPRDQGQAG